MSDFNQPTVERRPMSLLRNGALLAVLALMPAAAQAQTTITACYVPNSGSVYRIKASGTPSACKNNHVEFSWEAGISIGYFVRQGLPGTQLHQVSQTVSYYADCGEGEVAVGGGFNAGGPAQVLSDGPYPDGTGWKVTILNPGPFPFFASARATCLALPN
jgi:hypothetical protein